MHEKENNQEKSKKKKILISISDFDFRTHKGPKATSFYIEIWTVKQIKILENFVINHPIWKIIQSAEATSR